MPSKQGKVENSNSEEYVRCLRGNNAAVEKDELFNAFSDKEPGISVHQPS